ncbi:cyclase family protein [Sphaerisporangium sp. NPDC088356]|uniref:cyclase family protein n=1 Tax=Sphaerisporangium sp. NPDC088356 TaxID=3154871 RepID=UPI003424852D
MQLIDLSLPIESDMPHFDGTPPVYVAHSHRLPEAGFRMCTVVLGNHAGTHLDAPAHFLTNGRTVDEVPLERCVGDATVIDLSYKRPRDPITVADLRDAGLTAVEGCRVLLRTDWDLRFGEPDYFVDYPPLAPEAAEWLAEGGAWLVGLDIPSLHQEHFKNMHEVMLAADIAIIESLANLRSLTQREVFFSALPLRLSGADGAPVRAVAYDGTLGTT